MASRGNPFPRNYSTGDSSKRSLFSNLNPEEKWKEPFFSVNNKIVNDLRRHTRAYVKSIGGLPTIPDLPRREYKKKYHPILEDSVLVANLEELVETALQEVVQPLNQVYPNTPFFSPVHTPIHSPPHSPPRLMAGINANQPPNPPNPPPTWKARSPLNIALPLHDLPQAFEKTLSKFDPNDNILVDDHLQSFYLAIEGLKAREHKDVVCRLFVTPRF